MKKLPWIATLACAFVLSSGAAFAKDKKAPTPPRRQAAQQARIADGERSGELTKAERKALERRARRIHRQTVKDRIDDGRLTPEERVEAQRKLNRQSRQIYKQKNDDQKKDQ